MLSKDNGVTTCMEEVTYGLYQGVFLLPQFDNSSRETRDKEICQSHMNMG